jgi:hypothetical protein
METKDNVVPRATRWARTGASRLATSGRFAVARPDSTRCVPSAVGETCPLKVSVGAGIDRGSVRVVSEGRGDSEMVPGQAAATEIVPRNLVSRGLRAEMATQVGGGSRLLRLLEWTKPRGSRIGRD